MENPGQNESVDIPPEFEAGFLSDYSLLVEELRRTATISAGFFEKLITLDAASIAAAVTLGVAILTKGELHEFSHGLVALIGLFWVSLVAALVHNFLLVAIGKIDASYSKADFIRKIIRRGMKLAKANSEVDRHLADQVEELAQEEASALQRKLVSGKRIVERVADGFGYLSTISFFGAYTLVMYGAWRLWWMTK